MTRGDDDGMWIFCRTRQSAVNHAVRYPSTESGTWRVRAECHEIELAHLRRVAEREGTA